MNNPKIFKINLLLLLLCIATTLSPTKTLSQIDSEYQQQQRNTKESRLKELSVCYYQYATSPYAEFSDSATDWRENFWGLNSRYYISQLDKGVYKVSGGIGVDACSLSARPICYAGIEENISTFYGVKTTKCAIEGDEIVLYNKVGRDGKIARETVAYKNKKWNKQKEIDNYNWHIEYLRTDPPLY